MKDTLKSPQVLAAIITSIVTIIVALVPLYLNNSSSKEAVPTVIPATEIEITSPTIEASVSPVIATNTATSIPATDAPDANILLIYDDLSFTIYNQSSQTLSLNNLSFRGRSGQWDASGWGTGLVSDFEADNCLRLRNASSAQQQPPAICGTLVGLQLVGPGALFWTTDDFEVIQDGVVIASCSGIASDCAIFIP